MAKTVNRTRKAAPAKKIEKISPAAPVTHAPAKQVAAPKKQHKVAKKAQKPKVAVKKAAPKKAAAPKKVADKKVAPKRK